MTITYQRGKSLPSKTTDKESKRTLKTVRKKYFPLAMITKLQNLVNLVNLLKFSNLG